MQFAHAPSSAWDAAWALAMRVVRFAQQEHTFKARRFGPTRRLSTPRISPYTHPEVSADLLPGKTTVL